jgi:histidyl-tRNA synthetase
MGRPKKITPAVEKAPGRLPGTTDLLPEQHVSWDFFVEKLHNLARTFGYAKVEPPLLENIKLFKFWGQATKDRVIGISEQPGATAVLKPTNLFGLARIFLEYRFFEREKVSKWFYSSPVVLLDESGKIKQGTEFGFQIFGPLTPISDSQIINLAIKLFSQLGLNNLTLEVNNIGCMECLPAYTEALKNYFKEKKYDLCENCLDHLEGNRVLNILACGNLNCSAVSTESPAIIDSLCENCRHHFIGVLEGLDELSLVYNLNPKVVGKPWSRKTVFEIHYRQDGKDIVLVSGGHADDLIQSLGGPSTTALGFSGQIETVLTALELANVKFASESKVDVFLVPLGELAAKKTLGLFTELWNHNIIASEFTGPGSIKTQLKLAESHKASIALIIGQKEARDGTVILRDVRSGMQELFTTERIIDEIKKRLED